MTVEVNGLTFEVDDMHIEAVKRMGMLCVHGETIAYVVNRDDPFCSEIGSIGIRLTPAKGLIRTW